MATADVDSLPWPGEELAARVTGIPDREWFFESGRRSVADIEAALGVIGRPMASFDTMLDFGCGCGRMELWLADVGATCSLHAVDIDRRAIAWVTDNLPYVHAQVNDGRPPLPYPDGFFDLVFNHSVLTHLDEAYQDLWLDELRRVTRPGGVVVLSYHGDHAFLEYEKAQLNAGGDSRPIRRRLAEDGLAFIREDPWAGNAFPDFYHTTFHAPWYVYDHWSRWFTVRALVPRGSLDHQDLVVLERPADEAPAPRPVRPATAGTPAAEAGAPTGTEAAIARVVAEVERGPHVGSPTSKGALGRLARQGVLRMLRHYTDHQQRVQAAVVDALRELDRATRADPSGSMTLQDSHARIWDTMRRNGERVNRLEADVFEALRRRDQPEA